jgi:hypothetical protein
MSGPNLKKKKKEKCQRDTTKKKGELTMREIRLDEKREVSLGMASIHFYLFI